MLKKIDNLESKLNGIENTTAVSVVFLMKSSGVKASVSGEQANAFIQETPCIVAQEQCDDFKDLSEVLLGNNLAINTSFWDLLTDPSEYGLPGSRQTQIFLLDVFYASLTKETREIFVSDDFSRSLIYVDMPFIPVADTVRNRSKYYPVFP